jgi:hypothetical protein
VPPHLTDNVLDAVHDYEQRPLRRLVRCLLTLATSRLGRAAICTLALLLFAVRVASVLAIFLTELPAEGANRP